MSSTDTTNPQSVREVLLHGAAKRKDRELVAAMIVLGVAALVAAAWLGSLSIHQAWFFHGAGAYFVGLALLMLAGLRLVRGHYSLTGVIWFAICVLGFQIWDAIVMWTSGLSGWSGSHQPAYRLEISAAVGAIPLLIGIWQLGTKVSKVKDAP